VVKIVNNIAICIPTFKRNELLKKLIGSIEKQDLTYFKNYTIEIIVIDNDSSKSAKKIAEKKSSLNISYYSDPRKGLSNVRNSAIQLAIKKDCSYMAFLDDDEEILTEYWLENLFKCMLNHNADVVSGPVLTEYSEETANWIINSKFFDRKRYKTGTHMNYVGAGNVLINMRVIKENPNLYFDENFNYSGGEDTDFFFYLKNKGYKLVWCDEAVVKEALVKKRAKLKYMITRSLNGGMIFTKCQLKYSGNPKKKKIVIIINSILKMTVYLFLSMIFYGKRLNYLLKSFAQIGRFIGTFTNNINMYK